MMLARIRNVAGIASADILIDRITLIAGHNAAGKSSALQAIAACAHRDLEIRGVTKKKDLAMVVRRGADSGVVALGHDKDWSITLRLPSGAIEETGRAPGMGDAITLGIERFGHLAPIDRTAYLLRALGAEPVAADVAEFMTSARGISNGSEWADAIMNLVEASDWDGAHKAARDHATKLTGRWEQATGERWGSKKAETWAPLGLLPDELDLDSATEAVRVAREAQAALDRKVQRGAVSRDVLKQRADGVGDRLKELKAAEAAKERADADHEKAVAARAALPEVYDAASWPVCPHCKRRVRVEIEPEPGIRSRLTVPPHYEEISAQETKTRRHAVQQADFAVSDARKRQNAAVRDLADANAAYDAAMKAQKELAAMGEDAVAIEQELARAQVATARAEATLEKVQKWATARSIYAEWVSQQHIIAALAPDGVRAIVIRRRIADLNDEVAEFASIAGWGAPVVPEGDGAITVDGRPYFLLSESEQWRADALLQAALARRAQAALVTLDRLDVLLPDLRPGAMKMLRHLGCDAVVGMSARDRLAVPDLRRAGFGVAYWLDSGTASEIVPSE